MSSVSAKADRKPDVHLKTIHGQEALTTQQRGCLGKGTTRSEELVGMWDRPLGDGRRRPPIQSNLVTPMIECSI